MRGAFRKFERIFIRWWARPLRDAVIANPLVMMIVLVIVGCMGARASSFVLLYAQNLVRRDRRRAAMWMLDRAFRYEALVSAGGNLAMLYYYLGEYEACLVAAKKILARMPADLGVLVLRAHCLYAIGDNQAAKLAYERLVALDPGFARQNECFLRLAFLDGRLRHADVALGYYAMHCNPIPAEPPEASAFALRVSKLEDKGNRFLRTVDRKIIRLLRSVPGPEGRTAVFFFSPGNAIGHAVLEPFWLLNLIRGQFDRVVLIGAGQSATTRPVRTALQIVDQYVERLDTDDVALINLWWMDFGDIRTDRFTYILRDYRRLARSVYDARRDPATSMAAGRKHFALPPELQVLGEQVAAVQRLDLSRPIVVVHVREHGFHQLGVQAFRNAHIDNYLPTIRMLIDLGYLVVRVGDASMRPISVGSPYFIDLPHQPYAAPFLDPFFIARARFMIACQSGPCAYARAFGTPILNLNAVYHYSLIPEANELVGFKRYRRAAGGREVELSFAEIVAGKLHQLETTQQFERAGLRLEELSASEVTAATKEMLDWIAKPTREESDAQARFRSIAMAAANPMTENVSADHHLQGYLGYALPACRVSDAIARRRPGYL
jgi:putative glycosyltransferase (TIGR04372 family)